MIETDIYPVVRNFIHAALNIAVDETIRLPLTKIIIANQSNVRPKKPFVTLYLNTFKDMASKVKDARVGGQQQILISKTCVATINAFADVLYQAEQIIQQVYDHLFSPIATNVFKSDIAVRKILRPVSALPAASNEQIESRAILDLELGYIKDMSIDLDYFTQVRVHNQINNEEFTVELPPQ